MLWLWSAGPKQGWGLGGGRGLCLGPTGLEKALGAVGGWGSGSRNRRGPGVPPTPGLRSQGTSCGSSAVSPGPSGWGKHPPLLSRLSQRAPPACLSWSPWPQGPLSCLASTSPPPSVPPRPTSSLGGLSHLLVHQHPPPAASRCPGCEEMLTWCVPTPPSWLHLSDLCYYIKK